MLYPFPSLRSIRLLLSASVRLSPLSQNLKILAHGHPVTIEREPKATSTGSFRSDSTYRSLDRTSELYRSEPKDQSDFSFSASLRPIPFSQSLTVCPKGTLPTLKQTKATSSGTDVLSLPAEGSIRVLFSTRTPVLSPLKSRARRWLSKTRCHH